MPSNVRKILVVTLSNVGDVVMTLPVFQTLAALYPSAVIDVIVGEAAQSVFQDHPRIRRVIPYLKRASLSSKYKQLEAVRREHYDILIDLRRSLFGLLGGARYHNSYLDSYGKNPHKVYRHLRALRGLIRKGESLPALEPWWPKKPGPREGLDSLPPKTRIVVAAVGSKSDIKKWPASSYAALLDLLAIQDGCAIVLVGDKNDQADSAKVKEQMKTKQSLWDLTGQTDFSGLVSVIQSASLVVTNDSAPLHIADSLKVPVLAIFGPTDPRKYGPRNGSSQAVSKGLFCSPCQEAQCRYSHECLRELSVDQVYSKALEVLEDRRYQPNFKILLIRLDRLGDVVLSLPSVDALRQQFPRAFISMMVRPATREIVEGYPGLDEVIVYDYQETGRHRFLTGNLRLLNEVARRHFDAAFILNPSTRSYWIPYLAGIPYRIGFKTQPEFLLTVGALDRRAEGRKHEAEYTLDIVRAFGIDVPMAPQSRLPVTDKDRSQIQSFLRNKKLIVIHAGASCPSKRWPEENFIALGRLLASSGSYDLALIGGPEEALSGERMQEALGPAALNLCGKIGLKAMAALLQSAMLLISNDSGPVHVASAVGTPTLTIFGRKQEGLGPQRWKARGTSHALLHKDVGCVVCLAHRCPINFECLRAITVDEVFSKTMDLLQCAQKSPQPSA